MALSNARDLPPHQFCRLVLPQADVNRVPKETVGPMPRPEMASGAPSFRLVN